MGGFMGGMSGRTGSLVPGPKPALDPVQAILVNRTGDRFPVEPAGPVRFLKPW